MEEIRARRAAAEEAAAKASAVESNEIVEVKRSDSEEESHVFIAIGRVFSGKISKVRFKITGPLLLYLWPWSSLGKV